MFTSLPTATMMSPVLAQANASVRPRVNAFSGEEKPKVEKKLVKLNFAEDFMLSGVAATVSKTVSAPIERIKMVVQNQDEMLKRGSLDKPFKGIVDCGNWIMKNEGFAAFWKSNFTNCLRYFPTQALNFAFKGQIKTIAAFKPSKDNSYALNLTKNIASGGLAGGGSLCFVYSLDYARTRLANDLKSNKKGSTREFNGLADVYIKTFKADGFSGLYRGFAISFVGIFVYRGFYFGLYDTIMPMFPPEATNLALRFAVGYCVTVVAGLASYPIDTIRRRMMMTSGGGVHYNGSFDCAGQIMKNEGMKSFFKGAGANILRGVAGAGVLAGFDTVVDAYVEFKFGPGCTTKK
jgi:solute carrier family 25 (adenine nucleotide translocator) protein 4/5/6/31